MFVLRTHVTARTSIHQLHIADALSSLTHSQFLHTSPTNRSHTSHISLTHSHIPNTSLIPQSHIPHTLTLPPNILHTSLTHSHFLHTCSPHTLLTHHYKTVQQRLFSAHFTRKRHVALISNCLPSKVEQAKKQVRRR